MLLELKQSEVEKVSFLILRIEVAYLLDLRKRSLKRLDQLDRLLDFMIMEITFDGWKIITIDQKEEGEKDRGDKGAHNVKAKRLLSDSGLIRQGVQV